MFTTSIDQMLQYPPRPTMMMMNMETSIWKPHVEIAPNCPRCASPNTKFCYYNNYSLSQPRYFCKGCRRYWTKGGSLRNVPVGGGCRRNRRSRHSARSSTADRVGLSYLRDHLPSPTSSHGSDQSVITMSPGGSCEGPAEIDLADVFAKFLNQSPEQRQFGDHQDSSSGTSCGSLELPPSSFHVDADRNLENLMMECQINPSSFIEEVQMHNELPREFASEEDIQDFVSQHPNLYELQDLLDDDELPQDIAWKDDTQLSNCSWQQGFASASYNDQANMIGTNLVTDDWSSLDLSSYGIFTRP